MTRIAEKTTFVPNNPETLMRIFKSKTSKFTIGVFPNGNQICLVPGGKNRKGSTATRFHEKFEEVNVANKHLYTHFEEITFTNYIKQCELLMKEK